MELWSFHTSTPSLQVLFLRDSRFQLSTGTTAAQHLRKHTACAVYHLQLSVHRFRALLSASQTSQVVSQTFCRWLNVDECKCSGDWWRNKVGTPSNWTKEALNKAQPGACTGNSEARALLNFLMKFLARFYISGSAGKVCCGHHQLVLHLTRVHHIQLFYGFRNSAFRPRWR